MPAPGPKPSHTKGEGPPLSNPISHLSHFFFEYNISPLAMLPTVITLGLLASTAYAAAEAACDRDFLEPDDPTILTGLLREGEALYWTGCIVSRALTPVRHDNPLTDLQSFCDALNVEYPDYPTRVANIRTWMTCSCLKHDISITKQVFHTPVVNGYPNCDEEGSGVSLSSWAGCQASDWQQYLLRNHGYYRWGCASTPYYYDYPYVPELGSAIPDDCTASFATSNPNSTTYTLKGNTPGLERCLSLCDAAGANFAVLDPARADPCVCASKMSIGEGVSCTPTTAVIYPREGAEFHEPAAVQVPANILQVKQALGCPMPSECRQSHTECPGPFLLHFAPTISSRNADRCSCRPAEGRGQEAHGRGPRSGPH